MTHDLLTTWVVKLDSCFNRPQKWTVSSNQIQLELSLGANEDGDSLRMQVQVHGLPKGVCVSAMHVHLPMLNIRLTEFQRLVTSEEIWSLPQLIQRKNLTHCEQQVIVLQTGLSNQMRTEALVHHRSQMKQLHLRYPHSDMIVRVGSADIPAHKCILAAQSPVMAAAIEHSDRFNGVHNCLVVQGFEEQVVRELVLFLYTGETENLASLALDLYRLSDLYLITTLKNICEVELAAQLNVHNALDLLHLASLASGTSLKMRILPRLAKLQPQWYRNERFDAFISNNAHLARDILDCFYDTKLSKYDK